jgi:hypothetical protein
MSSASENIHTLRCVTTDVLIVATMEIIKLFNGASCSQVQGDQEVSVHLMNTVHKTHKNSVYSNNPHATDDLKMAITEYIRNVDRAILNTVFKNTVRHVNKCLETGEGHFEHYL